MAGSLDDVQGFISRMLSLPPNAPAADIDNALYPCFDADSRLRELFAKHRNDPRLLNMYIGLLNIFQLPASLRSIKARPQDIHTVWVPSVQRAFPSEYLLPLGRLDELLKATGRPSTVSDILEFRENFRAFTHGVLDRLDWQNVVVAGGSVLACLSPVPSDYHDHPGSYFHQSDALKSADIDLFIFGLSEIQVCMPGNMIHKTLNLIIYSPSGSKKIGNNLSVH